MASKLFRFKFNANTNAKTEEKKKGEYIGFTTKLSVNEAISRLQDMAAQSCNSFKVSKVGDYKVRIQGEDKGRKGKLAVVVELFEVSSSLLMVEVKKEKGDILEFNQFFLYYLCPAALSEVDWRTPDDMNITLAASDN